MGTEAETDGAASGDRTVEDRALEMGWIPPDDFKGDKTKFISAEDFVSRGETLMPLLKANNRKLSTQFDDLRRQNGVLSNQLNEALGELEVLKKGSAAASVEDLKSKRTDLAAELKIVRDADNTQREVEIQAEISEVNDQIREAEKLATAPVVRRPAPNSSATEAPEHQAFLKANPWYGTDKRKTTIANAIGQEIKSEDPSLVGKPFYDRVNEELEKTFGHPKRNGTSRVEGGARGTSEGGGGSSTGRTYSDLPADARAACDSQGAKLIGAGKKFKDQTAWRSYYVDLYFK